MPDIPPSIEIDPPRNTPSIAEHRLSLVIIGILALIAVAVYTVGQTFDPAQWRAQPTQEADKNTLSASPLDEPPSVAGLVPMSPPETYDAADLSDKIDGKAELYLSAGFKHLRCRRFALSSDAAQWLERFIYDMGSYQNAFAVFSSQRRDQAQPLSLTADAYRSANGLFFVQGTYYLEIIASTSSDTIFKKMTALAEAFVQANPTASAQLDERTLLPTRDRVADSVALTPKNAFGLDGFNQVWTAQYRWPEGDATAFLSRRGSPDEAAKLADAYAQYLITYGGHRLESPDDAPWMRIITILDLYEIVFNRKEFVCGVHEADNLPRAVELARQLDQQLTGARREH